MTNIGAFVAYYRVSTARQGTSGLGLAAQRASVEAAFLNGDDWRIAKEFTEIESGKRTDRPQLEAALKACRIHGARLVIAKLDRLSRDAHFLLGLEKAGVDFVAADMPHANRLTVGVMAMVAEEEGKAISARTKAALAAAKARGTVLGGYRGVDPNDKARAKARKAVRARVAARAADLASVISDARAAGATTLVALAAELNCQRILTSRGSTWTATAVRRLVKQLKALPPQA